MLQRVAEVCSLETCLGAISLSILFGVMLLLKFEAKLEICFGLRFLIALSNPLDRQNTESMVVLGLNLLTVALEVSSLNYLFKSAHSLLCAYCFSYLYSYREA